MPEMMSPAPTESVPSGSGLRSAGVDVLVAKPTRVTERAERQVALAWLRVNGCG
jgi:hypothetical protein